MNKVLNYQAVLDTIKGVKEGKLGYITNFYPDIMKVNNWIYSDKFYMSVIKNTLFLFRKNEGFVNLYYYTTSFDLLNQALIELKTEYKEAYLVVDLLGKETDVILLSEVFKNNDFFKYVTLCRMSKMTSKQNITILNPNVKQANIKQAVPILSLLQTYFDPIAEQLPTREEIINWIKLGHISLYESEGNILGFVIYDLNGLTSYLRYWFVHPEHRNEKIGSVLLNKYFIDSVDTKRQIFWVIQSNNNAIKRYKHYGFEPENLLNCVMISKQKQYEAKSN